MTSSNDENNFVIRKLDFLDTKNVKIEQILDSNLVIKRKSRVDKHLNSYLKFLKLLTNSAKICHAKRIFQVKAQHLVTHFMRKFSQNHRVNLELTKYLNFAVFRLEIANQFENECNFDTEIDSITNFSLPKILENEFFRVTAKLKKYWDLNLPEITLLLKITSFDKIYPSNSLYEQNFPLAIKI